MVARILVADDDQQIRELVSLYLESEGFTVVLAVDGHAVQRLALNAKQAFDMYILDIMMPGPDGYQLCKQLRQETDVPIIMLTAKDEERDKVLGFGLGADDYITKPFSPLELVARVRAHLRRFDRLTEHSESGRTILTSGPLQIDVGARHVTLDDRAVELTAKEYGILEYLAHNAGTVLTRAQIFEAVWDDPFIDDDNTVMVHIRHLREKLETDPSSPELIVTIRGLGYRFEGEPRD